MENRYFEPLMRFRPADVYHVAVDRLQAHRSFYADLITAGTGKPAENRILADAFRSTSREDFLGGGPWRVLTSSGYLETPSSDPVFLYQDIVVSLDEEGGINNGQPSLHALCLAHLQLRDAETVVHIGAGTGYYSAIQAKLVGPNGKVFAYEINSNLARRAKSNLAPFANVTVHHRSGSEGRLPECDALYVNAGATAPLDIWLDALRPGGRLIFPLTPDQGYGAMLSIKRRPDDRFEARFLCRAAFISCIGARDHAVAQRLATAFKGEELWETRFLHREIAPDNTCLFSGNGWWLGK